MADYKLYLLDGEGHIRRAVDIDCQDDAQAISTAKEHDKGAATELWQGSRVVRRFEPHDHA